MIYSIIPNDVIYSNTNNSESVGAKNMLYNGQMIEYTQNKNGEKIIQRVLSTDLNAYLDNTLQPGSRVNN